MPRDCLARGGTHQRGPRTGPVRSALEERTGLEKSAVSAPDNPLRTGTVRGPVQRDVPTGLNKIHAMSVAEMRLALLENRRLHFRMSMRTSDRDRADSLPAGDSPQVEGSSDCLAPRPPAGRQDHARPPDRPRPAHSLL